MNLAGIPGKTTSIPVLGGGLSLLARMLEN
jgi:hypothetical protein